MKSAQVVDSTPAASDRIMQLASGFVISSALSAITRLKIADLLVSGPCTATELARQTSSNADALNRVMRLLASAGIFEQTDKETYALNELSQLLRTDSPESMFDSVMFLTDSLHFECYSDILPCLLDGRTASEHKWNKNIFEVFAAQPDCQTRFDNAMTNMSVNTARAVVEAYDFSKVGTLVDVAGGHALLLSTILQKYPTMQGILFDMPHVTGGADKRIAALGLTSRCRTVGGDFFQSVPSGDAIIMKHIIHDWDDERALKILSNCRKALQATSGKLLLVELLLTEDSAPHMSKMLDVEMLVLPGGRERTREQYADLLKKAGFKLERVVETKSPYVVLESACI